MYTSMWILAEKLKRYDPITHIADGAMHIRNAGLLYQGERLKKYTVYVGRAETFISNLNDQIILVNQNDYILLNHESIEELLDEVQQWIDAYLEWDMQVFQMAAKGCELQKVLDIGAEMLQHFLFVTSSDFIYQGLSGLEYWQGPDIYLQYCRTGQGLPGELLASVIQDFPDLVMKRKTFLYFDSANQMYMLCRNIFSDGYYPVFCGMMIGTARPLPWEEQVFEVYYEQIKRWYENNDQWKTQLENEGLLTTLLAQNDLKKQAELQDVLNRLGWNPDDEKVIVEIRDNVNRGFIHNRLFHRYGMALYPYCLISDEPDRTVLLMNTRHIKTDDFFNKLSVVFRGVPYHAGISGEFTETNALRQYAGQAAIAAEYGVSHHKTICYSSECILDYIKSTLRDKISVQTLEPSLILLAEYDQKNHTCFLHTLQIYLNEERSMKRTAVRMHIHINTLKYRIKKIETLLSCDLNDGDTRLRLLIAFLMLSS